MATSKKISPERYLKDIRLAGILLTIIVLTGASVRLTEAGLGCQDWPACNQNQLLPEWEIHGLIEFGNRLLSGAVAIAVIMTTLNAYRRTPKRQDLINWAWGLVAGVLAQILLGGATVLLTLHPAVVGAHYALSLVLLWNVVVLWEKAQLHPTHKLKQEIQTVDSFTKNLSYLLLLLASCIVFTGILVTGTGPNSGDSQAARLPFHLETVARIHGITVWSFLVCLLWLTVRTHKANAEHPVCKKLQLLLGLSTLQGGIGYLQYILGVPPAIVILHIAGSLAVWITTLSTFFQLLPTKKLNTTPETP